MVILEEQGETIVTLNKETKTLSIRIQLQQSGDQTWRINKGTGHCLDVKHILQPRLLTHRKYGIINMSYLKC